MKYAIFKPIIIGLLLGAGLYFMPFFMVRLVMVVLIIGLAFRFFNRRGRGLHPAFTDQIRNMTEEEYTQFKTQRPYRGCGGKQEKKPTL